MVGSAAAASLLGMVFMGVMGAVSAEVMPPPGPCPSGSLALYNLTFTTFWSRDRFPKHFPEWRPPAHWSPLVGFSHGPSFVLFRVGARASAAVRQLAETGHADAVLSPSTPSASVLDAFAAPALAGGVGRVNARFFADANHSRVSLMARMAPSPDWFVGLDAFELCVGGQWLEGVELEADPLDAGTDNGFTFTAPNWPTEPQGRVYRVTSRFPPHPAGSFYYPERRRLPPIAAFHFAKVREYEVSSESASPPPPPPRGDADLQAELAEEAAAEAAAPSPAPAPAATAPAAGKGSANATVAAKAEAEDEAEWFNSVAAKPRKKHWRSMRGARDCRVGEWGPWAACSRSCGVGETQRRRPVLRHARRSGRPCPPLAQTKWCGSARGCSDAADDDQTQDQHQDKQQQRQGYFRW